MAKRAYPKNRKSRPGVARIEIPCEMCGAIIRVTPGQLRVRKVVRFCSRACCAKAQIVTPLRPCATCGVLLRRRLKKVTKRLRQIFCSAACRPPKRLTKSHRPRTGRWNDPAFLRNYMREYVKANRKRHNERSRDWAMRNQDKRLHTRLKRRSRHQVEDCITPAEWLDIKRAARFKCLACGKPESLIETLELDHIQPLSRGGSGASSNIQPLCRSCNAKKGARHIDYRKQTEVKRGDR